ncbi:aminoglycoside phosphotransferase family protein [Actinophytocola algeriensis]|uniref:Aminoglycoside phosphotransferase (APT) family kinase protein n=1 Tax=Actinophytocola algeriensis TaxID=1768010 RepID=A0A7W7Q0E9_9PSEU|nr:aminoglycoside phosphotransferase family protein [Actinophytocola algeriensis]MBB4904553.1 aminoglycoside phosphotransferase (APT) family kinase protein [Actinophytocola algeriensis]MBE1476588.1 aminoglycoside phosphotransferase (APT) family kinase protein [Actinophytocola algeriensis]
MRMHPDEAHIDTGLVRRLVAGQFPEWAALPVEPVPSSGTDNAMYRLGDDLSVRLPRIPGAADDVEREQRWLPRLAPHLPVTVPSLVTRGVPAEGYPHPWAVYRWLPGANPVTADDELAEELAAFVHALRKVPAADAPAASRGVPLAARDAETRAALARSADLVDTAALTRIWDEALRLPARDGPPTWLHGDLTPGNVLVRDGRLSAVIDWSCAGVGDPTVDLEVAWNLLPAPAREVYRAALAADEVTWLRGRAWALSIAIIQLPYYLETNPALAANSRHVLAAVLAD